MTLVDIGENFVVTVLSVGGSGHLRQRLLDMGFTPGTEVSVLRVSSMGSPVLVSLRGSVLAIGLREAGKIFVSFEEKMPKGRIFS